MSHVLKFAFPKRNDKRNKKITEQSAPLMYIHNFRKHYLYKIIL